MNKIFYLGYEIQNGAIRPGEDKIRAVWSFPEPQCSKEVQRFLGLSGYFRKFVYDYSLIAKPLSDLLREDRQFVFGSEQKEAFKKLKMILIDRPVLTFSDLVRQPNFTLMQVNGHLEPFCYKRIMRTRSCIQNLSSYELEMLAVVNALKKMRVYTC